MSYQSQGSVFLRHGVFVSPRPENCVSCTTCRSAIADAARVAYLLSANLRYTLLHPNFQKSSPPPQKKTGILGP